MKKKKLLIIIGILAVVGMITAGVLYFMDWGNAESKISKTQVDGDLGKLKTESGKEVFDLAAVKGVYVNNPDPTKSEILFIADGPKKATGTFQKFKVSFSIDGTLESAKLVVDVDASSVFTDNSTRDSHINGDDFLNTSSFPSIVFTSKSFVLGKDGYEVNGTISLLGLEKEFSFPFVFVGKGKYENGAEFIAFESEFIFPQTSYGVPSNTGVADEIKLTFYVELVATDAEIEMTDSGDDFDDFDDFGEEESVGYEGDELDAVFDQIELEAQSE